MDSKENNDISEISMPGLVRGSSLKQNVPSPSRVQWPGEAQQNNGTATKSSTTFVSERFPSNKKGSTGLDSVPSSTTKRKTSQNSEYVMEMEDRMPATSTLIFVSQAGLGRSFVRLHLKTYLIQWLLQTFFPLSLPFAACLYGRRGLSTMSFWPLSWRDKDRVPDILWQWGTSTLMITAIIIRFTFCLGNACNAASDIVFGLAVCSYIFHRDIIAMKYAYMTRAQYKSMMRATDGHIRNKEEQLLTAWLQPEPAFIEREMFNAGRRLGVPLLDASFFLRPDAVKAHGKHFLDNVDNCPMRSQVQQCSDTQLPVFRLLATLITEMNRIGHKQRLMPLVFAFAHSLVPIIYHGIEDGVWFGSSAAEVIFNVVCTIVSTLHGMTVLTFCYVGVLDFQRRFKLQRAITDLVTRTTTFSSSSLLSDDDSFDITSTQSMKEGSVMALDLNQSDWEAALESPPPEEEAVQRLADNVGFQARPHPLSNPNRGTHFTVNRVAGNHDSDHEERGPQDNLISDNQGDEASMHDAKAAEVGPAAETSDGRPPDIRLPSRSLGISRVAVPQGSFYTPNQHGQGLSPSASPPAGATRRRKERTALDKVVGSQVPLLELDNAHNISTWLLLRRVISSIGLRFWYRVQNVVAKLVLVELAIMVVLLLDIFAPSMVTLEDKLKFSMGFFCADVLYLLILSIAWGARNNQQFEAQIAMLNDEQTKLRQLTALERARGSKALVRQYKDADKIFDSVKGSVEFDSKLEPVKVLGMKASYFIFRTALVSMLSVLSFFFRFLV